MVSSLEDTLHPFQEWVRYFDTVNQRLLFPLVKKTVCIIRCVFPARAGLKSCVHKYKGLKSKDFKVCI